MSTTTESQRDRAAAIGTARDNEPTLAEEALEKIRILLHDTTMHDDTAWHEIDLVLKDYNDRRAN